MVVGITSDGVMGRREDRLLVVIVVSPVASFVAALEEARVAVGGEAV